MLGDRLNILLVEDNPGDARLFKEALNEAHAANFALHHCTSLEQALACLSKARPDVIVVDLGLPDAFGIDVVRRTRMGAPAIPVVVLTSRTDEALGLQALHEGAQDYLIKGELDPRLLSRALRYAIERQRMQAALQSESLTDELTKLHNRRGFMSLAGSHIKSAEHTQQPFALVFIDLDGMKDVNDTLGHVEGDRALVETASLLSRCVRQTDIVARFGGDEFVLLLTTAEKNWEDSIRHRLQQQLDASNAQPGRRYHLSFSVGVVTAEPDSWFSLEDLVAEADAMMYRHKQKKKATA
ncbi:MAG: diguanylate cyclase [Steroidobacteraceae bacterium]